MRRTSRRKPPEGFSIPLPGTPSQRILGIDPGSYRTGWGLLGGSFHRPSLIDSGVIEIGASGAFPLRLSRLQRELQDLLSRLQPTGAAVESPFHGVNARSALQLAHARGVVLAVVAGTGIEVVEYAPAAVKKSVTGTGGADKAQVEFMVARTLGPAAARSCGDRADAIAVALCHLFATGSGLRRAEAGEAGGARRRSGTR